MAASSGTAGPAADAPRGANLSDGLLALARGQGLERHLAAALAGAGGEAAALDQAALLKLSGGIGLRCRALKPGWAGLVRLGGHLPGIVTLKGGNRLLLLGTRVEDGVEIAVVEDPRYLGGDPLVIDRLRFEAAWTGELILASVPARAEDTFGWRVVAGLVRQEPRLLRDGLAATLALAGLAALPILFVQLLLQRVLPEKTDRSLLVLSVGFLAVVVIEAILRAARGYLVSRLAARTEARLATRTFDRLLTSPIGATGVLPQGDTRRRIGDLKVIQAALATLLPSLALDVAVLVVFLPLMAYLDPILCVAFLLLAGFGATAVFVAMPRLRRAAETLAEAEAERGGFLMETIAGIGTIKGLALTADRLRRWDRLSARIGRARLEAGKQADRLTLLAVPLERALMPGLVALGVGLAALQGTVAPVAPLIAFALLAQRLVALLPATAAILRAQASARVAMRRLRALFDQPSERSNGSGVVTRGGIVFDGVRFRYPEAPGQALRGVSFAVEPGTHLGIMGRSGAGKSTIARLLQRLHAPQAGTIRIDGTDIGEIVPERLRRAVVVVPQNATLFAGTIRETITAAKPDANFAEMAQAAKQAGADDFIDRLPRGYETRIADGAPTLSAGQRQRLALARALITDPPVLILDEALSALDAEIEATVEGHLREARRGRTTIMISHRLAALMHADMILVLAQGEVRDIGRHADLLEHSDVYGAAWIRQQGAIESDAAPGEGLLALS